jgi:hypothetical protein
MLNSPDGTFQPPTPESLYNKSEATSPFQRNTVEVNALEARKQWCGYEAANPQNARSPVISPAKAPNGAKKEGRRCTKIWRSRNADRKLPP